MPNTYVITEPCRGVADWYASFYEWHAEREQLARAEGRVEEENAHHAAIVVLIRALTAEQVPT